MHRIPIISKASAGSLNNSTIYHSIDVLNDSLKPRDIARVTLIPQTQKPTRPELSVDSSTVISPSERKSINQGRMSPAKLSPIKNKEPTQTELKTPAPAMNTGSKARLSNYILRADASRNKDEFRKAEDEHRRSVSREASQTKSYQNGSAYKQMIKTVKHRVDCWNKSG